MPDVKITIFEFEKWKKLTLIFFEIVSVDGLTKLVVFVLVLVVVFVVVLVVVTGIAVVTGIEISASLSLTTVA